MPTISRWFVRAALLQLGAGFSIGAALLWSKGLPLGLPVARVLPLHQEILLVGWTVQLVMGVALWIFPRFGVTSARARWEGTAWLVFGCINTGPWLAAFAPTLVFGRVLEAIAATLFALVIWPRVRASGLSPM